MSQAQQQSLLDLKKIEIVLSTRNCASFRNGSLRFQLNRADFLHVAHLVWLLMKKDVPMMDTSNILNVVTCQSEERKR